MLKWLLKSLLIIAVLVPYAAAMPLASVSLCRTPGGAEFVFWTTPFSAAVLTLIYSQWSSAHRWNRMGRLKQWRADHGGIAVTVSRATGWMFFGLFGSYACETAVILATRSAAWLPLGAYCPLALCWLWRRKHA